MATTSPTPRSTLETLLDTAAPHTPPPTTLLLLASRSSNNERCQSATKREAHTPTKFALQNLDTPVSPDADSWLLGYALLLVSGSPHSATLTPNLTDAEHATLRTLTDKVKSTLQRQHKDLQRGETIRLYETLRVQG